jgi:MFS family permease
MNIGGLMGSFIMGHLADSKGARAGLFWAFISLACGLGFILPNLQPWWSLPAYFGGGFFNSAYPVLNIFLIMKLSRPGRTTEFTGAFNTITLPLVVLAPLLHGWLAQHLSYTMSFCLSLAGCAAGLILLWRSQLIQGWSPAAKS